MSDPVRFTRAYLERRIQELEAQCAATRKALGKMNRAVAELVACGSILDDDVRPEIDLAESALATDAGKAMLERLERAETESAGWKAAMNVHAERAEKAERERDEFEARIDSESAQAQEDRWNQALEEAAKVAEAEPEYPTDWPPEKLSEYAAMIAQGDADVLTFVRAAVGTTKESIATAIRARKTGGA